MIHRPRRDGSLYSISTATCLPSWRPSCRPRCRARPALSEAPAASPDRGRSRGSSRVSCGAGQRPMARWSHARSTRRTYVRNSLSRGSIRDVPDFRLVAPFEPTGDQPAAIERLVDGLGRGLRHQTLLGATGTGKTFVMAQTIARCNKPTLVLAHNKTLAAQLYAEFREFFPDNAVEYFVSYFDYYQPEAYLPRSDTYIEKDSSRNEEIDRLRHAATHALFERRDVIIVASVSCIYGLGAPVDYGATVLRLRVGGQYRRDAVLRHLVDLQYQRNDAALSRARFRVRGDTLEIGPASSEEHRPRRVLRRRGRADHRAGPAHRRAPGRAQGAQHLPGQPLRDAARQAAAGDPGDRRRDGGAGWADGGRGPRARGGPPAPTHHLRPRDDARAGLLHRGGELQPPPLWARAGKPAVDAAGLLPAGLAAHRGRVAHDDPAGGRHVQERPDPQGDPGRLRLPPPVRAGQPPADLRGVRGARQPGDVRVARRPARTSWSAASASWSS